MRLLVCGGAGFIGSNFIHYMRERYPAYALINFDKLTYAGNLDNLRDISSGARYIFARGDVANTHDVEEVITKHKPDAIINFAAETHNDKSVHEDASAFVMTNVVGVQVLLDAARRHKIGRFVQVSTDEVYGDLDLNEDRSFKEHDPLRPNLPYSAAKAGGDLMCRAYYQCFKTPVMVTHCTNNYGPYQYPEKLIPFFTIRANNDEFLPLYGDGRNVRDWIYVIDHCRALDMVLHKGKAGELYNIDADSEHANIDIANMLLRYMGKAQRLITFVKDRPGHDRRYSLDAAKIQRELGWEPLYAFEKMLPKTIDWYLENQWWLERLKARGAKFNAHIARAAVAREPAAS